MKSPRVAIVILNWNGWSDTEECLQSLFRIEYSNYFVVLIDNGSLYPPRDLNPSDTGTAQMVLPIRLKQNLGFSGGSNIGIKKALEHGAEFTLLLNNDTIVTKNFLSELVNASQTPEAYRIIGGKIFYHRSGNTLWYKGGYISKLTGGGIHREKGRRENGVPKAGVFPVTFVTGCMCLIHKSVFKEIGLLDTSYFLYCEDTDFCMRAGKRGIPMAVNPASIIYHKERSTKNGWQPDHIYYLVRNRILFMQRFKGPHSFLPLFYIFLLLIGALPALLWALSGRTNLLKASVCGFMDGIQKITGPRDLPQRKRPG